MRNYPKEKYLIMRDRPHVLSPVYWNALSHTSFITRGIHGIDILKEWNIYKNGRMQSIFIKNDWDKVADIISKKLLKNKKYFRKLQEKLNGAGKRINLFFISFKKKNISKLRFNELVDLAHKIKELWLDYDMVNVPPWHMGGDKFKERIQNLLNLSHEDFLFLTTPLEKTSISKFEYDLLKYTNLVKESKKALETTAENLSEKYGWIPFGYDGPEYWDKNYFIRKLKKDIKTPIEKLNKELELIEQKDKENLKKRKKIVKKYKLNKKQLDLIDRINTLATWTDERKKLTFKFHYYYSQVLLELGKRYNIPYKNLKYLFTEELVNIKKSTDKMIKISEERINDELVLSFRNGKYFILSGKKKNKILKELETRTSRQDIRGMVACRGVKNIYRGKVKILLSPKEGNKVKNGDFLVTTMTTPDCIMPMKKAAGFITDEGGVTCHAAIVAREMKKPCIIGTKIATKVLKDGDLVEVDADKGIVRILRK